MADQVLTLKKLMTLLDHLHDAVFAIEGSLIVYANQAFAALVEYPMDEILQRPFTQFIHEEDIEQIFSYYQTRLRGENIPNEYEFRMRSKHGIPIEVRINVGVSVDESGLHTSIGTLKDMRETKRTMRDLAQSQRDIASILNNMPDVFYRANLQGMVTMMSPSCKAVLGYEADEMVGQPMIKFYFTPEDREKVVLAIQQGQGSPQQIDVCMKHKDGSRVWISTNAYMLRDENGKTVGLEGIARNISERKALEEKLTNLARIDDLTQIYNRRYFYEEAEKQLLHAHRYQHPFALLMLDLDFFKQVNDTYGHRTGDELLKHFAQICREIIRETDIFGRMGGEEFAILLPETDLDSAMLLTERIRHTVETRPLSLQDAALFYSTSLGIAMNEKDGMPLGKLLSHADKALYAAKSAGRNRVCVHRAEDFEVKSQST